MRSNLNGHFYVGMTQNVVIRIKRHNKGATRSTKPYRPWELVFFEAFDTRIEARKREVYLKSGIGKEYIKNKWSGSSVG